VYKELSNDNFFYLQYGAVCLELFACNKKRLIRCTEQLNKCLEKCFTYYHILCELAYLLLFLQDPL